MSLYKRVYPRWAELWKAGGTTDGEAKMEEIAEVAMEE